MIILFDTEMGEKTHLKASFSLDKYEVYIGDIGEGGTPLYQSFNASTFVKRFKILSLDEEFPLTSISEIDAWENKHKDDIIRTEMKSIKNGTLVQIVYVLKNKERKTFYRSW